MVDAKSRPVPARALLHKRNWCLKHRLLTKNAGSPKGEKSTTVTFTGLSPCCWGLKNLGNTLRSCLELWPTKPCNNNTAVTEARGEHGLGSSSSRNNVSNIEKQAVNSS